MMTISLAQTILTEPWPFWAGGVIIGLMVPALYFFFNKALGVSTGYGNLVKLLTARKLLPYFKTDKFKDTFNWRFYFIIGIIIGAFISGRISGVSFNLEMGALTALSNWPKIVVAFYLFVGGIMLGLGARIAGGCTSGHSIHGIANGHQSSILVTIVFLIGGVIAANLLRFLVLGGNG